MDFIYLFFCQYTRPNKKVCGSGYILKKIRVGIFFIIIFLSFMDLFIVKTAYVLAN